MADWHPPNERRTVKASDHPSYLPTAQGFMGKKLAALVAANNAKKGR